ncbi:hypothetical protein ABVK25_010734 [Lepraria finkii]|uniref:PHD-type domain-containing protein n=1 Tax=Lepraria finkii TaxID=1340010 RepID=A0ABR4ATE9_9LECA
MTEMGATTSYSTTTDYIAVPIRGHHLHPHPSQNRMPTRRKVRLRLGASKRRKTEEIEESANDADGDTPAAENGEPESKIENDGFGGRKWECIAVTLTEYQDFLESIKKSRDADEKYLHKRVTEEVLPIIEKSEESRLRKKQKQERELINMQKLATAKRSSRLEAKQEREREEREAAEAEQKKKTDLLAAKQDQEKQRKMEEARENRMMTREQRIKEREYKRILHEEELANLSEENKKVEAGEARLSERHLKTEMEKKKKELAALAEEDEWFFDCSKCGVHGTNLDDGSHSVACDKCNVWQHSVCLGISQAEAEKDDFHFVCHDCKRREEDAKKPKIPSLKFHLGSSSSPPSQKQKAAVSRANGTKKRKSSEEPNHLPPTKMFKPVDGSRQASNPHLPQQPHNGQNGQNGMHATVMNGPTLSPQGQVPHAIYSGNQEESFFSRRQYPNAPQPPPGLRSPPGPPAYANGYTHHTQHMNGNVYNNAHVPQLPQQNFQSPESYPSPYAANGSYGSHQPQNVGWSARYTPPHQAHPQQAHGPPPSQNPFANSFDRQRPASSHSPSTVPSPVKNGPSLSPPQHSLPEYNLTYQTPHINQTPYANGNSPHQALPPTGPPAYSPVKHPSPPSVAPPAKHPPSSSPIAHQPPLQNNAPASPGFSPTKHSPAHQPAPGYGMASNPTVLLPAPQRSPSPMQSFDSAMKSHPVALPPAHQLSPSPMQQNSNTTVQSSTPAPTGTMNGNATGQ